MLNVRVYRKLYGPFPGGDLISAPIVGKAIAELHFLICSLWLVTSRVSLVISSSNNAVKWRLLERSRELVATGDERNYT
jgi:hypothetical protein